MCFLRFVFFFGLKKRKHFQLEYLVRKKIDKDLKKKENDISPHQHKNPKGQSIL